MNQAIHFPDLEQWDDERQGVCFPALVGGKRTPVALPKLKAFTLPLKAHVVYSTINTQIYHAKE